MPSRKETAAGIVGVSVLSKSPAARRALVGLLRQGGRTLGPWGIAAWLAYEGYVRRDQIRSVANEIAERLPPAAPGQGGDPTFGGSGARSLMLADGFSDISDAFLEPAMGRQRRQEDFLGYSDKGPSRKRVKTKFNKAMGKAMTAVKKEFKRLKPATQFKKASKIASKANPVTKSRIGKGKSFAQKTARKIRKSVWGTIRRKK